MNYSYLMGVKDITELKNNGFIVEEIDGNYGIKFEKDKAKFYEEFIIKNLEVGYWNEYLGDKIVFIFKFNDGSTKKYIYNKTNEEEILNLCCKLVTTNKKHIAYSLTDKYDNLDILYYEELDLTRLLKDLSSKYNAERLTIQSGGNLNGAFLRNNLIDYVNIVIAPLLVGGKDVSTLIDGEAISCSQELNKLKALELIECNQLDNSYIQLKYKVKR